MGRGIDMLRKIFTRKNSVGFILKITGLLVVVHGLISGIVINATMAREFGEVTFIPLSVFFKPIIIGILIIGFGEFIDLLQEIADKGKPTPEKKEAPIQLEIPIPKIPLYAEAEINEFYSNKNMKVNAIEPTKKRDLFIVKVDSQTEYIELGGFSPEILSEKEAQKRLNETSN